MRIFKIFKIYMLHPNNLSAKLLKFFLRMCRIHERKKMLIYCYKLINFPKKKNLCAYRPPQLLKCQTIINRITNN